MFLPKKGVLGTISVHKDQFCSLKPDDIFALLLANLASGRQGDLMEKNISECENIRMQGGFMQPGDYSNKNTIIMYFSQLSFASVLEFTMARCL